jgi:hypothetical protein
MYMQAFAPKTALGNLGTSLVVASSGTANSAALPFQPNANAPSQVYVCNVGSGWLWLNFGTSTLTPAATPTTVNGPVIGVAPNSARCFTLDPSCTTVSYLISTGSGTMVICQGEGI